MKTNPWTAERAAKYLPLFLALAEGKTIQFYVEDGGNGSYWSDIQDPDFTAEPDAYRIKPDPPKVLYVNEYTNNYPVGYGTKEEAIERADIVGFSGRVGVKYVEAVD